VQGTPLRLMTPGALIRTPHASGGPRLHEPWVMISPQEIETPARPLSPNIVSNGA